MDHGYNVYRYDLCRRFQVTQPRRQAMVISPSIHFSHYLCLHMVAPGGRHYNKKQIMAVARVEIPLLSPKYDSA